MSGVGVIGQTGAVETEIERRLVNWIASSGTSEHLATQVLHAEGNTGIDPAQPRGGPDGGKDALFRANGDLGVMAAYFPRDPVSPTMLRKKFEHDLGEALKHHPKVFAFVTNQRVTSSARSRLRELATRCGVHLELFHLDRLVTILSRPETQSVAEQFLGIPVDEWPDQVMRDIDTVAARHEEVQLDFGARCQAFVWPAHLQVRSQALEAGVALLRRGQELTDVLPASVVDPVRSDTGIVLVCGRGVNLQEVGNQLLEVANNAGLAVSPFGERGARSLTVWACGPGSAAVRQCFENLITGVGPGAIGYLGSPAWVLTPDATRAGGVATLKGQSPVV